MNIFLSKNLIGVYFQYERYLLYINFIKIKILYISCSFQLTKILFRCLFHLNLRLMVARVGRFWNFLARLNLIYVYLLWLYQTDKYLKYEEKKTQYILFCGMCFMYKKFYEAIKCMKRNWLTLFSFLFQYTTNNINKQKVVKKNFEPSSYVFVNLFIHPFSV